MAYYAFIDEENIVTEVIVGKNEGNFDWERQYSSVRGQLCKRTSYNTYAGVHSNGKTPLRKNYASVGYTYDSTRDAFISPKPHASWTLVEDTCLWTAPVSKPDDDKMYEWDESTTNWVVND
jgi:hypothetical protein|tara:strand:+ start:164 stop:526 length:363 start_codon:yes stop_codon:yes gene_type:complete